MSRDWLGPYLLRDHAQANASQGPRTSHAATSVTAALLSFARFDLLVTADASEIRHRRSRLTSRGFAPERHSAERDQATRTDAAGHGCCRATTCLTQQETGRSHHLTVRPWVGVADQSRNHSHRDRWGPVAFHATYLANRVARRQDGR